jgi:AraC-like DNA-binding protein
MMAEAATISATFKTYAPEQMHHSHSHQHQLILPRHGLLDLTINGAASDVAAGQLAVVPAGMDHGFAAEGRNRFLVLDVGIATHGQHIFDVSPACGRGFVYQVPPAIGRLCRYVQAELRHGADPRLHHQASRWLAVRLQDYLRDLLASGSRTAGMPASVAARLHQAAQQLVGMGYIAAQKKGGIAQVAAHCGFSAGHFRTLFKHVFACSPVAYARRHTILACQEDLKAGMRLVDIAYKHGFADQSSFGRAFRAETGQSPRQWYIAYQETICPLSS